jgi:hypothetical protein
MGHEGAAGDLAAVIQSLQTPIQCFDQVVGIPD